MAASIPLAAVRMHRVIRLAVQRWKLEPQSQRYLPVPLCLVAWRAATRDRLAVGRLPIPITAAIPPLKRWMASARLGATFQMAEVMRFSTITTSVALLLVGYARTTT